MYSLFLNDCISSVSTTLGQADRRKTLYLNLNSIEIYSDQGQPLKTFGDLKQNSNAVFNFLKQYLPCS